MKIAIVGAFGFIGRAVCNRLEELSNFTLLKCGRRETESSDLKILFSDVEVVIYCAGVAHLSKSSSQEFINNAIKSDFNSAIDLFGLAKIVSVKRVIYLSSVNVFGSISAVDSPFSLKSPCYPEDAVSTGKRAIENALIEKASDFEFVIIRSPLVYGKLPKANFATILNIVRKNLPLPLGAIHNCRSLVALDNLVDLIITCIDHPKAANQTFLISDDCDVSTTELLKMMTRAAGKKPWLIPVPMSWFRLVGKLTGKQAIVDRLCGNLQVDISHTKETLGWKPPISVEEGIKRCFYNVEC